MKGLISMELWSKRLHTAQDLYEFLSRVPEGARQQIPLLVNYDLEDKGDDGFESYEFEITAEAFIVTETEGCIERGFRINIGDLEDDGQTCN